VSVQESAVELEHLLEKPSLTPEELKGLVSLFSRLLDHPLTGSADNDPRRGFLSFYWEGRSSAIHPGTGGGTRRDGIGPYSRSIPFRKDQRDIRGSTSEGWITFPKPFYTVNRTEVVSALQSLTGRRPLEPSSNTLAGSPPTFYWVLKTLMALETL